MAFMNFSNDFKGEVNFEDLEVGCVFLCGNVCYIKTWSICDTESFNAVNLTDGTLNYFTNKMKVFPVKCTLHIEEVGVV